MPVYGTGYGGWWLPENAGIGPTDVIVSAGAGEDVSFDLAAQYRFGCEVPLVDPTERAVKHWEQVKTYYAAFPDGRRYI